MILEAICELGHAKWEECIDEHGVEYWQFKEKDSCPIEIKVISFDKYNNRVIETHFIQERKSALTLNDKTNMNLKEIHKLVLKVNKDG